MIARLPLPLRWLLLVAGSIAVAWCLLGLHIAAALLVGPMVASIALAALGGGMRVPSLLFQASQAIVGCMIGRVLQPSILDTLAGNVPLFGLAVLYVLAAACALGMLLTRLRVLPGTVALWGSFPGAATAMVLMAEAYGADIRLVAFMQYLRVVVVALVASLVARIWAPHAVAPALVLFPPLDVVPFAVTMTIAGIGWAIGRLLRVPAGPLLLPMVLAALGQDVLGVTIELPPALLAAAYALIGWTIGQRFTREILVHVAHALPRVLASIGALVLACGLFAGVLVVVAGIDPLTAYLATSPGGADSVAIIAASSHVDMPFVMALQVTRFLIVLLFGPKLARMLAARFGRPDPAVRGTAGPRRTDPAGG